MKKLLFLLFFAGTLIADAQFAPPAGQPGTSAIHKDSSVFIAWATGCQLFLGPQDISNDTSALASVGTPTSAIGPAGTNGIVSLGDGGSAILAFTVPVADGPGYDFAVFENSFSDDFLEFGFVEVSSDGQNFFRFPAVSHIQDSIQTGPFDLSDASKVNNLAGKYRANYGTPFDLQELSGTAGLDVMHITHIKIVDVVGSIDPAYATYDSDGNKINDPFPTPFPSSGFDLDAVGIIHTATTGIYEKEDVGFSMFPNPCKEILTLKMKEAASVLILSLTGKVLMQLESETGLNKISISNLEAGVYFVLAKTPANQYIQKIIKQ